MIQIRKPFTFLATVSSLTLATLVLPAPAQAEKYRGIGYHYSMNDLMAAFPNAEFKTNEVAWTQKNQKFITISGSGITGEIMVLMEDTRPSYYQRYLDAEAGSNLEALNYFGASREDKNSLMVEWLRWVPPLSLPVGNIVRKFGKGYSKVVNDEDFSESLSWSSKAVTAQLNQEGNKVLFVTYSFTSAEILEGWLRENKCLSDAFSAAGSPEAPKTDTAPADDNL